MNGAEKAITDLSTALDRIQANRANKLASVHRPERGTATMRPEIKIMYDLIRGFGLFNGFKMIGATNITFDNKLFKLAWQMPSDCAVRYVEFTYNEGMDDYKLVFLAECGGQIEPPRVKTGLYAEDVRNCFERETGYYLSL